MRTWHKSAAAVASAAGLLVAVTADHGQHPADGIIALAAHRDHTSGHAALPFTLNGRPVAGLYPGATRNLPLVLANPYSFTLRVTTLDGAVVSSSRKRCKPVRDNIRVRSYTGRLPVTVPPYGKVTVHALPVVMPPGASADCAATVFTLRLSGTATRIR